MKRGIKGRRVEGRVELMIEYDHLVFLDWNGRALRTGVEEGICAVWDLVHMGGREGRGQLSYLQHISSRSGMKTISQFLERINMHKCCL